MRSSNLQRRPERGRPLNVLRYIDHCLDPRRPFIVNLNGGPAEAYRAMPEALAGLWAAQERLDYARAKIDAQTRLIQALEDLDDAMDILTKEKP